MARISINFELIGSYQQHKSMKRELMVDSYVVAVLMIQKSKKQNLKLLNKFQKLVLLNTGRE